MAWGVSDTGAVATGTTELVMDVPAATVENDLMVCRMVHKGAGFATLTGWTNVAQVLQGSTRGEMYWKRASGAEPGTYTATGLADTAEGYIQSWPGALLSGDILDAVVSRGNAITVEGTGSLTVGTANALVIGMSAVGGNVAPGSSPRLFDNSGPASYLMRASVAQQSATGTGCSLAGSETMWAIPGATGAFDYVTGGGAAENVAILASFTPEADAATGTFTKFYATAKQAGTRLHGLPLGDWDQARPQNRGVHHWQFLLDPYKSFGGVVTDTTFGTGSLKTADELMFVERWISPTLAAQTLTGNFDLCFRVEKTDAAPATMTYHLYAYVTSGNTLTERTVLINDVTDSTAWTQTATYRTLNAPIALSNTAITAGDRIVVEIGVEASPNSVGVTDNVGTLAWGTTDSFQLPLADAADTDTSDAAAWVEFDGGLEIQDNTPSVPANDACADSTAITSTPYTLSGIDTRGSLGAHRALYWTFTAPRTTRYFFATLGGNYAARVQVFTGACGSLSLVSNSTSQRNGAQGTSQSVSDWDATAGTVYTIWVQNYAVSTNTAWSAMDSGGSLAVGLFEQETLAAGDLFMACQHLVRFRGSQLETCQSDFYNSIPSGLAIDYSLRSLDDLNGGTDTSLRLYAGLFASGSGDIVEILDLATLNVAESEIDFINAPFSGNEKIQSLQIGANGTLYTGWDGDNYTWIGDLSSAAACAIRSIDATHADNQTGAPFAAAESFQATREVQGSDYITLSGDQSTLFYASAGQSVLRCNIVAETQGTAFATLPTESGPRPGLRQMVLLPPGDGSGGLIVCEGINLKRLDAAGNIVMTYTPSSSARYQDIDKIVLDPDTVHVWCADALSASLAKFNISTGAQEEDIQTHLPPGQVSGITIYSEGPPIITPSFNTENRIIRRMRRTPHLITENVWQFFHRLEIHMQTGNGIAIGQGEDPQVMLRWSYDGGRTWSNEHWVTSGRLGTYATRAFWTRLGRGRNAVFEVTVSDPVGWYLIDAYLDVERGTS